MNSVGQKLEKNMPQEQTEKSNEFYPLFQPGWSIENAELCRLPYLVSNMNTAPGLAEVTGQLPPRSVADWERELPTIHSTLPLSLQSHAAAMSKSQGGPLERDIWESVSTVLIRGGCQPIIYARDDASDSENEIVTSIILENKLISYSDR